MPNIAANLSMLFNEFGFLDRFEAASQVGFKGVEFHFPYDFPASAIKEKLEQNNLKQVLFNLPAGDWDAGERGIACHPDRIGEFRDGVDKAIEYAKILDCNQCNALSGITPKGYSDEDIQLTFVDNIRYAASKMSDAGIRLLIEAINTQDIPGFYLNNTAQALSIIDRAGSDNIFYQYDIYHMQIMEENIAHTIQNNISRIAHFQLADNPGRHEPGTGEINYPFLLEFIDDLNYEGWIGAEYIPAKSTGAGLAWFDKYKL